MHRSQIVSALVLVLAFVPWVAFPGAPASGLLHISSENPGYFSDGAGKSVYLVGSHTWPCLVDGVLVATNSDSPPAFDFTADLDFLAQHRHNFIRLWTIHSAYSAEGSI